MTTITTVLEMQAYVEAARRAGKSVGCVPTMGALHAGHASLVTFAAAKHDVVVTSIFVNPTQFGPGEDYDAYPRNLERDIAIVEQAGGAVVFAPTVAEMYPNGPNTTIHVGGVTEMLEGASRLGHFDGVATVVCKLFEAMRPDEAYFGQKDFQQTLVVKRMTEDLLIPVTITVLPTLRESDGLAMSSRNAYMNADEREQSRIISKALFAARDLAKKGENRSAILQETMTSILSTVSNFIVEYAVAAEAVTLESKPTFSATSDIVLLIAGRLGRTRLIDNVIVSRT
ncbi:MAG: pantoate--beta-alanine ligase [bacterium]|nr:pantoate--beta-alanine ligase [bacterium]